MTENLRIINRTIYPSDSDIDSGSFTIPASNISGFGANNNRPYAYINAQNGYYSYWTAKAGGSTSKSICALGWSIPTLTEFQKLGGYYPGTSLYGEPLHFTHTDIITAGSSRLYGNTNHGYYWSKESATVYLIYGTNYTGTENRSVGDGCVIRCISS